MKMLYPAKITYSNKDKSYLVEFPDMEGCLSEGATIEQALRNAKEALTGYLSSLFERGFRIPESSRTKGRNYYMINPASDVATHHVTL